MFRALIGVQTKTKLLDATQPLEFRGVDQGTYPSSRIFSIGLTTTF